MKTIVFFILTLSIGSNAQSFMMNSYGSRNNILLNGKWKAIIDLYSRGEGRKFYQNRRPQSKTEFIKYSFDNELRLNVPGDFNSQTPELKYYEGDIWYQRYFKGKKNPDNRQFIYFSAVNYKAAVWLNGVEIGRHEGGFTPFQFEVTDTLKDGENHLVILVNNKRIDDGIPAMNFDWWNYGEITCDEYFIETPSIYISDYKLQLKKGGKKKLSGYVKLDGTNVEKQVEVSIPELNLSKKLTADEKGLATFEITANQQLWEPESQKLYDVKFINNDKTINDKISFRTIDRDIRHKIIP